MLNLWEWIDNVPLLSCRCVGLFSPSAPQCIGKTSCSLQITWEDGGTSGDSIDNMHASIAESEKRYELQMRQLESGVGLTRVPLGQLHVRSLGWTTVATDLLERQAAASDLLPLRYYCFRARMYLVQANNSRTLVDTEANKHDSATVQVLSSAFSQPSAPIQTLRRC